MKFFKATLLAGLVSSAFLPWNATAINRADFASLLGHSSRPVAKLAGNLPEELLVKSLLEVTQGNLQDALDTINQLLEAAPNFKLAYLVRGDLLMARAQQFQSFGNPAADSTQAISDFQQEARKRIERHLSEVPSGNLPEPLWQLDSKQSYAIVVDTSKSRLYLYRNENGQPKYVADYYATIGKNGSEKKSEGDKRTPIGVYFAGSKLNRKLDAFYGDAAYPLSYPNEWDRRQGKSGGGIWLHGTPPNMYSRPPNASDGCVVISNPDLKALAPILERGNVPFIIANNLQWLKAQQEFSQKDSLAKEIEHWRNDWQSQNTDLYLSHYSQQFSSDAMNYGTWATEKRRIQASKPKVDIQLSGISMFSYPGGNTPMAVVTFEQSFKSPYLDSQMRKRQYWILENQRWKIIYEGSA